MTEYEIGIPIAGSPCSYAITPSMSINKTGALISPTYPGAYPKDMSCTYQFLGDINQRVRLEFRDFDLFFGGPHDEPRGRLRLVYKVSPGAAIVIENDIGVKNALV
uniref:CUB domain-containing protein n=1 Tax=Megaselia scalaris TaxID=36166 RepID=T1GLA3_MEGSC